MEEQLFGEQAGAEAPPGPPAPPAEGTPAVPAAPSGAEDRLAALESAVADTNQAVLSLTRTLATSAEQALAADAAGREEAAEPDMDQFRQELVNDPAGTIDRRAAAVAERLATEQLNPTLVTIIEATHDTLLAKHEAQITNEFGEEAWSKVIEPALKEDIGTLRERNIKALADQTAIKALVDRQVGMNYRDLAVRQAETKEAKEKAMAEQISTGLPQGGQPKVRLSADQPDEDIKTFWGDIEEHTGEKVDRVQFMKLHAAGNTIDDYLAATAKEAK